jgi:hypothetical protein
MDLTQGQEKDVTIGITRGKNFDQDVTLEFEGLPKGVTAEKNAVLKKGDEATTVKMKAAADAALGKHDVTVVGKPKTGDSAEAKFTLTVKEKK